MRAATITLLLVLCAAPAWAQTESEDFPRPQGGPAKQVDPSELPAYPETAPQRPPGDEYKDQDFFWFNDNDGKQQWEDPALVHTDEEGHETYTDPKTGRPTDAKPAEAAWLSLWDEEHETEYFYNEITKESTWEVPHLFAWHKVFIDENGTVVAPPEEEPIEEDFEDGEWAEEDGMEFAEGEFEDGGWEEHGEGDHEPTEEELAEEQVLREEAEAAGGQAEEL